MKCGISCAVAVVFIVASVYLALNAPHSKDKENFYRTLSPGLQARYEAIIQERKLIYMRGFALGLVLSAVAIFACGARKPVQMSCLAGAITLATTYLFYIIHPKTDYMVLHLDKTEQRTAWLNVYRSMQLEYHIGLVLGIGAAMALGDSVCC